VAVRIRHVAAFVMLSAVSAHAHQNFRAEFDIKSPFTVTGTVTRVEWTNPHTWFYLDVKDDKGTIEHWSMEMGSPNALMRAGWKRTSMNAGDLVTVDGYRSWDRKHTGNARAVVLTKTGQKLFAASSAGQ
jgi:DNA/RNA endonuclease YhcR with UshA esterase domain